MNNKVEALMKGHNQQDLEGPHVVEEGIWVDLGNRREHDISSKLMETMHNIKTYWESINDVNNKTLLKAREEKEEIKENILKILTNKKQNKNIGQSTNNVEKRPP